MRKKIVVLSMIVCFALVGLTCNATAQKAGSSYNEQPPAAAGAKGRLQALVAELSKSKNPEAKLLAKKIKGVSKELKKDGKDMRPLQPHLGRMEKFARAGDFEAADRALMDAIGVAYDGKFWEKVSFKSVDGFVVYGYLSKPEDREKFPIIVLVHGGQHGSSTTYQRHALKFLKVGYATLAVDYRGSSGHGDAYKEAYDPAGKEIDDVLKAVEFANADPSTTAVGLMGASHGAFISGNVLPRTSVVTAANLNFGGYDFKTLMKGWEESDEPIAKKKLEVWGPIVGEPGTEEFSQAADVSPIYSADKISATLLLIHGKNDAVLSYSESINFYNKLKEKKKKVTLKLFDDGPHGFIFRNTEEAEEAYRVTESFFKQNLK